MAWPLLATLIFGCNGVPKPPPAPTFAHVEKQAPPTAEIFVAAYMDNAVIAFPPGAHGNVSPSLRIGEVLTASGVARDSKGRLYVTNGFLNTISIFAPGADTDTLLSVRHPTRFGAPGRTTWLNFASS